MAQSATTPTFPDFSHLPGEQLLMATVDWIEAHPQHWDQTTWVTDGEGQVPDEPRRPDCGWKGCLAGWITLFTGMQPYARSYAGYHEVVVELRPNEYMLISQYAAERIGLYTDGEDDDVLDMFSSDVEEIGDLREKAALAAERIRDNLAAAPPTEDEV